MARNQQPAFSSKKIFKLWSRPQFNLLFTFPSKQQLCPPPHDAQYSWPWYVLILHCAPRFIFQSWKSFQDQTSSGASWCSTNRTVTSSSQADSFFEQIFEHTHVSGSVKCKKVVCSSPWPSASPETNDKGKHGIGKHRKCKIAERENAEKCLVPRES